MNRYCFQDHLFAGKWMDEFERIWNSPANAATRLQLAGTGKVLFILCEEEKTIRSTIVNWDKAGAVSVLKEENTRDIIPAFSAPFSVWESLIYNYYTPIQAVVNKKMEFEGRMMFAVKFSEKFNLIADVAIAVNKKIATS